MNAIRWSGLQWVLVMVFCLGTALSTTATARESDATPESPPEAEAPGQENPHREAPDRENPDREVIVQPDHPKLDITLTPDLLRKVGRFYPPAKRGASFVSGEFPGVRSFSLLFTDPKDPAAPPSVCAGTVLFNRFGGHGAGKATRSGAEVPFAPPTFDQIAPPPAGPTASPADFDCLIATARHCGADVIRMHPAGSPGLPEKAGEGPVPTLQMPFTIESREFSEGRDREEAVTFTGVMPAEGIGNLQGPGFEENDALALLGKGTVCERMAKHVEPTPPCPEGPEERVARLGIDSLRQRANLPLMFARRAGAPPPKPGARSASMAVVQPDVMDNPERVAKAEGALGVGIAGSGAGVFREVLEAGTRVAACFFATLAGVVAYGKESAARHIGIALRNDFYRQLLGTVAGQPPVAPSETGPPVGIAERPAVPPVGRAHAGAGLTKEKAHAHR